MSVKEKIYKRIGNKIITPFSYFFKTEAASGIVILISAFIAMVIANSNFAGAYENILHRNLTIGYKEFSLSMSLLHWINDGLMVIFFFVVGMEIKRELIIGELKSFKKTILPIAGAIGGMVVPAIIYTLFNYKELTITGWAIPMATDIAFALGILSLAGKKVPKGIVVFLTALAIVDDLGAIIVIAIFYTNKIFWSAFIVGCVTFIALIIANKINIKSIPLFVVAGLVLWVSFLKSGIHPTIAGVLLGITIPCDKNVHEFKNSMLYKLEHSLTPWSAFLIMPIFALSNSGVPIDIKSFSTIILTPVSLGIILGLFIGKQLGVFGVSYVLIKLNLAKLPHQVTKMHLYGASVLSGFGFTMSLFISSLSFSDVTFLTSAKISIIVASILSGVLGLIIFKFSTPQRKINSNGSF